MSNSVRYLNQEGANSMADITVLCNFHTSYYHVCIIPMVQFCVADSFAAYVHLFVILSNTLFHFLSFSVHDEQVINIDIEFEKREINKMINGFMTQKIASLQVCMYAWMDSPRFSLRGITI